MSASQPNMKPIGPPHPIAPLGPSHPIEPIGPPHIQPDLNPNIVKDLELYAEDMQILHEELAKLKKMAAGLKDVGNVMYEIIQIFGAFQNVQGSKVRALADVDNIDSTLRSGLSTAQGDMNSLEGQSGSNPSPSKKAIAEAQQLIDELKGIQNFLNYEKSLGKKSVIDGATIKNLQSAINSIKNAFDVPLFPPVFGHAKLMAQRVAQWIEDTKNGKAVPAMKNIQDGFQTINQSVSELSASTNSRMRFVTEEFKQAMGMQNTSIQTVLKWLRTVIQNFRSN